MRILLATEGIDEAGGVDTYLSAVAPGLVARGHQVAILHCNRPAGSAAVPVAAVPRFGIDELGPQIAFASVASWDPDVCFSQNMHDLDVDARLASRAPVVKMMHGYFGTCVSGQKSFGFPFREPCDRIFGPACLALYLPRRCGQLRPGVMLQQYAWAREQRVLFDRYSGIVVASEHMRREFERTGAPADKLHVVPLFAPGPVGPAEAGLAGPAKAGLAGPAEAGRYNVLFLGRMTALKGGDLLIEAVAGATRRLARPIALTMAGEGPERSRWEAIAARLGVDAEFPGWLSGRARDAAIRRASLVAVPSVWPEPFGLTGLEAAAYGVPAVAFDVGGIREWLRDGETGILASGARPEADALATAIVSALGDPARLSRLGEAARAAAARLSLDRHLDRLVSILESVAVART